MPITKYHTSLVCFRYKKTLMAKKAAALQSFQKCDVQNLAIPSTIVEDTEFKHNEDLGVVFVETEKEKEGVLPSDRIEVAVSPAR